MDILTLRKSLNLSQEAFAAKVGLKSKGQLSMIERGQRSVGPDVAMRIEELSGGAIPAASLSRTLAAADAARQRAA